VEDNDSNSPQPSLSKRFARRMTHPGWLVSGIVWANIQVWLTNHHHVPEAKFWPTLGIWLLAVAFWFAVQEIQAWTKKP
jgi:hypothetical protein